MNDTFTLRTDSTRRPYNAVPDRLYELTDLMEGYDHLSYSSTKDSIIGDFFEKIGNNGYPEDPEEALAERLHDHYILSALNTFLVQRPNLKLVGIMGGHDIARTHPHYRAAVLAAYNLACQGYTIVSGGGLGIMEAANLGAYMSAYTLEDLNWSIQELEKVPNARENLANYTNSAIELRKKYPDGAESLVIPTWLYRNEPLSQFSTYIAKLFANSIREDGLVSVAKYGIIFFRGGAGTIQELWQDAAQNAYAAAQKQAKTPIVLYDSEEWDREASEIKEFVSDNERKELKYNGSVYKILHSLAISKGKFEDYIKLAEDIDGVVDFIINSDIRNSNELVEFKNQEGLQ